MEATCSSETFVDFQQPTRCYIPEDRTFHNHVCEKLISYMFLTYFWMYKILICYCGPQIYNFDMFSHCFSVISPAIKIIQKTDCNIKLLISGLLLYRAIKPELISERAYNENKKAVRSKTSIDSTRAWEVIIQCIISAADTHCKCLSKTWSRNVKSMTWLIR
jgi:hypothetical protein